MVRERKLPILFRVNRSRSQLHLFGSDTTPCIVSNVQLSYFKQRWRMVRGERWVNWLFNVTINNISVMHVNHIYAQADWRRSCWTYGRAPTPYTFRRVHWRARPSTDTGANLFTVTREIVPFRSPFTTRTGIRSTYSRLKPRVPTGEDGEVHFRAQRSRSLRNFVNTLVLIRLLE